MEMSKTQYFERIFSHAGQISMTGFRDGKFNEEAMKALHATHEALRNAPFHFYKERSDLEQIKSLGRRLQALEGIKLLVIDYLQRIRTKYKKNSRVDELDFIANDLKDFALETGLVIWCPVQLNKESEVR